MNMISAQADFLQYCRRKNLSDHTIRAYRQDLNDFGVWARNDDPERSLTKYTIGAWISYLSERRLAPATIKRRVACLKVLCRWLEDEGLITPNPFNGLRTPIKIPKRLPKNLSNSEMKSLIGEQTKSRSGGTNFRLNTLFLALEILFATGIRVGELCSISLDTLDLIPASIERDSFGGFPSRKKSESMRRTDSEVRHGKSDCVKGRF